jgi:hypothetical protein
MKIKLIPPSSITNEDIEEFKSKISSIPTKHIITANDVDIDKRIIFVNGYVLVNPTIIKNSNNTVLYYEKDSTKLNKIRKTVRFTSIVVDTDNLGHVEFYQTNEKPKWDSFNHFMEDVGLIECVSVQRAIDAINGIDITHPLRAYNEAVTAKKTPGRNERVMIQSPEGETLFLKYKNAESYINIGYSLL